MRIILSVSSIRIFIPTFKYSCNYKLRLNAITAHPGTTISSLQISGATFGAQKDVELKLVDGHDLFTIDAPSKALILRKQLDRETVGIGYTFVGLSHIDYSSRII
jgi:hypothetical protein